MGKGGRGWAEARVSAAEHPRKPSCPTDRGVYHLSQLPCGYSFDPSKTKGYRAEYGYWAAVASCFDWHHNEFANIQTELIPIAYFCATSLYLYTETWHGAQTRLMQQAVLATNLGAVLQHVCSLVAHVFSCISPRLSHAIWFVDYAGIVLNFVWNTPAIAFMLIQRAEPSAHLREELREELREGISSLQMSSFLSMSWLAYNLMLTALLLGGAIRLAYTHQPSESAGSGATFLSLLTDRRKLLYLVVFCMLPNLILTLAAGVLVDVTVLAVLLILPLALSVKELNLPERFAPAGAFDLSCLHSHSLWHVCVWLLQMCYARSFFAHLGPGNGTGILLTGVDWVVAG